MILTLALLHHPHPHPARKTVEVPDRIDVDLADFAILQSAIPATP
jgi:hypothetical protein